LGAATYTNIGNEKDVSNPPRQKPTIRHKIVYLIAELSDDSQRIFKECHNNQETTNSGHISVTHINKIGEGVGWRVRYGLTQLMLFSKTSSNLPVYCLIWSRGEAYVGDDAFGGWMRVLYG
jgi:hypothetical protein